MRDYRADFPLLHKGDLAYWDSAATTQKPQAVIDRLLRYYTTENANIHRGVYRLSADMSIVYEQARATVAAFCGASEPREIAFVRGTTEAINLVASSYLAPRLLPGDTVLVSHLEHHANILPWQRCCQQKGAHLRVIPVHPNGDLDVLAAEALLAQGGVRFLAIAHIASSIGTRLPIEHLIACAHAHGVPVLVDGAQAVSREPVDVHALGADFYVFSGHKLYGPTGIGALYARWQHWETMEPYQVGGGMIQSVTWESTLYADAPTRFEAGTPNIAGAVGLATAIEYVQSVGWEAIGDHEQATLSAVGQILGEHPALRIIGQPERRAGLYSFVWDGVHPHDVGTVLDAEGVAVRVGHHCAMPLMQHWGLSGTVRVSVGLYNNTSDLEALSRGLQAVSRYWGG